MHKLSASRDSRVWKKSCGFDSFTLREGKNSGQQQLKFRVLKFTGLIKTSWVSQFSHEFLKATGQAQNMALPRTAIYILHPFQHFKHVFSVIRKHKPVTTFQSPSAGGLSCNHINASDLPSLPVKRYPVFTGGRALLTRDTHKAYAISTHEGPPPPSPWPYSNMLAWTCPLSFSCLTVFKTWQKQEALFLNFVK